MEKYYGTIIYQYSNIGTVNYVPSREVWKLQFKDNLTLESEMVKTLNPLAFKEITDLNSIKLDEALKAQEEKRIADEAERQRKYNEQKEALTKWITPLIPVGFTGKFNAQEFTLTKDNIDFIILPISYSKLDKSTENHARVTDTQYHHRSFKSVEKAIQYSTKKIDELIAEKNAVVNKENEYNNKTKELQTTLKEHGITTLIATKYYSTDSRGRSQGSYKERRARILLTEVKDDYEKRISLNGKLAEDTNITNVNITGQFTPAQFRRLADFINDLGIEKA